MLQIIQPQKHNKLQNKFLNDIFVKSVCKYILGKDTVESKVEFESDYNWDIFVKGVVEVKCNHPSKCYYDEHRVDNNNDEYHREREQLWIEIKTLLGDEYPCVLRK